MGQVRSRGMVAGGAEGETMRPASFGSKYIDPSCGEGEYLSGVLLRELTAITASRQEDWEVKAITAVSSLYGICPLEDKCRERLFRVFDHTYTARFKRTARDACRSAVRYILSANIVRGGSPVVLPNWIPNGPLFTRQDYWFYTLTALLAGPIREYPPVHYLRLGAQGVRGRYRNALFAPQKARSARFPRDPYPDRGSGSKPPVLNT